MLLAAQSGTSNFALALSSLLGPVAAPKAQLGEAPAPETLIPERQTHAEPGKDLPEIALDLAQDEEASQDCSDDEDPQPDALPFAWFAAPAAAVPEAAAAAQAPVGGKTSVTGQTRAETLPLRTSGETSATAPSPVVAPSLSPE
ncbi:MAG: hypothetical protein EOP59_14180, partial [Sphingomonadales bacterium]